MPYVLTSTDADGRAVARRHFADAPAALNALVSEMTPEEFHHWRTLGIYHHRHAPTPEANGHAAPAEPPPH